MAVNRMNERKFPNSVEDLEIKYLANELCA